MEEYGTNLHKDHLLRRLGRLSTRRLTVVATWTYQDLLHLSLHRAGVVVQSAWVVNPLNKRS